jgi:hypothetical protein
MLVDPPLHDRVSRLTKGNTMGEPGSTFLHFNLPNATTWFYFSWLLALALFFKFSRFLSVRNLDVVMLFLLMPGLLVLLEARRGTEAQEAARAVAAGAESAAVPGVGGGGVGNLVSALAPLPKVPSRVVWYSYLWLLGGSVYLLIRCLIDLALVRRPALAPNLNASGLAWLGGALFVCLVAVAFRNTADRSAAAGKESVPLKETKDRIGDLVNQEAAPAASAAEINFWVGRGLAMLCHLAIVAGLIVIGCWHFQDVSAGMAMATFYLLLPYTAVHVGQVHHVWPAALVIWAVTLYRQPTVAGLLLGLAAGSVYFPVLLFPLWLSFYWRRGAGRFSAAFLLAAGVSLALTISVLWSNGELARSLQSTLALTDWQPWKKPTTESEGVWQGVYWAYRTPVFIAYLAFVLTTAFWPAPKNLGHLLALSAAVLIGIQFWYGDQGGVYVLWYLPLLLLLVFRPNLSERRPLPIVGETDWLARLGRALARLGTRLLRLPEPAARVA